MSRPQKDLPPSKSAFKMFWEELGRRKVFRVASVYIVTAWLIIQVAAATFPSFGIPNWAFRFVTLVVMLGFPVAIILAWAFELTPDGIKTNKHPKQTEEHSENQVNTSPKSHNWQPYALGALLPTLVFGALAIFFYINAGHSIHKDVVKQTQLKTKTQSIAMMPLLNMSSSEENEHFAGGVHEDVLTNLSRIKDFQVISRTSMLRFATSEKTLKEIGTQLGVDYIVEGSVRRIGSHVRVTIQLINAKNDLHIWANNFERELLDVFATQSELAKEISNSLHLEIAPESVGTLKGMPTFSVKAYDLYTKAVSLEKTTGGTEQGTMLRREMLEEAVTIDPDFAQAWAILKRIYDYQANRLIGSNWFAEQSNKKAIATSLREKSKRALGKAVALAPNHIETLLSLAVDHTWPKTQEQMQARKKMFDQITSQYPNNAYGWYHLAWWHSHRQDLTDENPEQFFEDAALAFEKALTLDPFNARMLSAVMNWYKISGIQKNVESVAQRLVQILPETTHDRSLFRVSWFARKRQIVTALLHTADESFIQQYKDGLEEALDKNDHKYQYEHYWDEMEISAFTNDENNILKISRLPFELKEEAWNPTFFAIINATVMKIHLNKGDLKQAQVSAQRIIDNENVLLSPIVNKCECLPGILASAYAILGDKQHATQIIEQLSSQYGVDIDRGVRAMSLIDLDKAVDMAFSIKEKTPKWRGFDDLAAYQILNRKFIIHPKVQEYYVKEGKWVNYLAARVPEYKKYKN